MANGSHKAMDKQGRYMKIAIASDHAAYDFKVELIEGMKGLGYDCDDLGPYSTERTHYPIWAQKAACAVAAGRYERAILLCDSGVGMCMAANKVKGIRAVVCSNWYTAKYSPPAQQRKCSGIR